MSGLYTYRKFRCGAEPKCCPKSGAGQRYTGRSKCKGCLDQEWLETEEEFKKRINRYFERGEM